LPDWIVLFFQWGFDRQTPHRSNDRRPTNDHTHPHSRLIFQNDAVTQALKYLESENMISINENGVLKLN
jgi:hypothetical protein